jgi:glycosyltransferase involved in cell wall biosynthesis
MPPAQKKSPRAVLMLAEHSIRDGGIGAHVTAASAALRAAGDDVTLVVGRRGPNEPEDPMVRVIPGIEEREVPAKSLDRLNRLIDELTPELIHLQHIPDGGLIAELRQKAPVLYNVHNHLGCTSGWKYFRQPGSECTRSHGVGCIPNLMFRGCAHTLDPRGLPGSYRGATRMVNGLRKADLVVAHSRFMLQGLHANEVGSVLTVPLFVASERSTTPPPEDGPILFVGRVTEAKGLSTLIRSAATVDADLEVVGDGWWMPAARRLARRLGITKRVNFAGWLHGEDLRDAYRRARIMVVPSHWPEPVGMVGLEAMAAARPVIATATGGIPEWLDAGRTGLLVNPGDPKDLTKALDRILRHPEMGAEMGIRGAERIGREFSEERYLEALRSAYALTLSNYGRA